MTTYEFLCKTVANHPKANPLNWRYKGPGYGQRLLHVIGILEPNEVVTCSLGYGWLGTPEEFIKQFDYVK